MKPDTQPYVQLRIKVLMGLSDVHVFVFPPPLSGWRRGPAGSSVLSVKRASAERRSSHYMVEAVPARRTPGTRVCFAPVSVFLELYLLTVCVLVQVENSTSASGTETGAREQRRGQWINLFIIAQNFSHILVV